MSEALGYPWPDNTQRLRLGDVEFDLRYRSVCRDGRVQELNQRCFDLLLLFLREPRLLHTREEIFRRVWTGVVVEDANITTSIWVLRKALGDDAKGWIRTVAKQGYVFDPPGDLEPASSNDPVGRESPLPAAKAPLPTAAMPAPSVPARGRQHFQLGVAALLLVALVIALFSMRMPPQTSQVMILAVPDVSLNTEARWPADLLQSWIEWQLGTRTDRIKVADASGERESAEAVVLLSAAMPVGRDSEWHVRAHLHEDGRTLNLDHAAPPERMLATIDTLSRDVVRRFMPDVAAADLPSLVTLDAAAAPSLVRAIDAERRGRWNEAAALYRHVLDVAPDFGFARLHLAAALAELGQSNAAQAELVPAERWVASLPQAMQPLLRARILAIRQDYLAAAGQFGELAARSIDERLDLRLAEATNLRRGGHSRDALDRLSGAIPAAPSQALAWLIERGETELATLDLARSRATAGEAIRLARALGWDQDRARATLLLMDGLIWSALPIDDALYDDAIAGFTSAGDKLGMLRAKLMRDIRDSETGPHLPDLDELLAEARAAGNAAAEIDALRRVGQLHLRRGETRGASERLRQAEAVADTAGDRYLQRQISANLLRLDMWRGDLSAADRRLRHLRAESLQGSLGFLVGLAEVRVQFRRGHYEAALATAAATQELLRVRDAQGSQPMATGLDCARETVLVRLGRIADAKTAIEVCGSPNLPYYALHAVAARAELAILAGDATTARASLLSLADSSRHQSSQIERWMLVAEVAPMLSRVGELERARELVDAVIPVVTRSGFIATEVDLRLAAAEIAFAQGRVGDARQEMHRIRPLVQPDDWFARQRLQSLDVLVLRADGERIEATQSLKQLHAQTRERGDVLGELLVHSIAGAELAGLCPEERQVRLLAQSGMRGASQSWLVSPALRTDLSLLKAQPDKALSAIR